MVAGVTTPRENMTLRHPSNKKTGLASKQGPACSALFSGIF
jgi:hypothetical protein